MVQAWHAAFAKKYSKIAAAALALAMGFGVSHSRMFAAEDVPARRPAASLPSPLVLLDNFADPAASAKRWKPLQGGMATIAFEKGQAVLDMPASFAGGNRAQLYSNAPLHLNSTGDALRITWDMQLLKDRANTFGFGLVLGDPAAAHILAAQLGNKNGDHHDGPAHAVYICGRSPSEPITQDKIDHGTGPLHYDLTVTLEDAEKGTVRMDLRAFKQVKELDATPEMYLSKATAVSELTTHGVLTVGADLPLFFCVERDDDSADPYSNQGRGKISVTNVFIATGAAGDTIEPYVYPTED